MSKDKSPNQDIVDILNELSDYELNVQQNLFKANAYSKAARVLGKLKERIKSGKEV